MAFRSRGQADYSEPPIPPGWDKNTTGGIQGTGKDLRQPKSPRDLTLVQGKEGHPAFLGVLVPPMAGLVVKVFRIRASP